MQFINSQSKRKFKVLKDQKEFFFGVQPNWYSSRIEFRFEDKSFEIRKNNFWGTSFECLINGLIIAEMSLIWRKENTIKFKEKIDDEFQEYRLRSKRSKGWLSPDKVYTLTNKLNSPVLKINFSYKKFWKEEIHLEFIDKENYALMMCAMFIIRQRQDTDGASSAFAAG